MHPRHTFEDILCVQKHTYLCDDKDFILIWPIPKATNSFCHMCEPLFQKWFHIHTYTYVYVQDRKYELMTASTDNQVAMEDCYLCIFSIKRSIWISIQL